MNDFDAKIGTRIKKVRTAKNMSQEQLAERTGLSTNHISKVERGLCSAKLKNIVKICTALGISLDTLVLGASPKDSQNDILSVNQMATIESHLKEALSVLNTTTGYGPDTLK